MTGDQDPVHHAEDHDLGHLVGDQYHGQDHDHQKEDLLEDRELILLIDDQSEDQDLGQGVEGHFHRNIESHFLQEDAH